MAGGGATRTSFHIFGESWAASPMLMTGRATIPRQGTQRWMILLCSDARVGSASACKHRPQAICIMHWQCLDTHLSTISIITIDCHIRRCSLISKPKSKMGVMIQALCDLTYCQQWRGPAGARGKLAHGHAGKNKGIMDWQRGCLIKALTVPTRCQQWRHGRAGARGATIQNCP